MRAITAVAGLLRESRKWRRFFRSCCQTSALRLRSQGWQFRNELRDRGHDLPLEETEDALFELALQEHYAGLSPEGKKALDLSRAWKQNEHIVAASLAEDRAALREAVRGYEQEALMALHNVRSGAKRIGAA